MRLSVRCVAALCAGLTCALLGCARSAQDHPQADATQDVAQPESSGIPGYVHTFARSRFELGTMVGEMNEYGMHKITGTDGVFATEIVSQAATAIPNTTPPSLTGNVFPGDARAQDDAVKSYFTHAGLPSNQVSSVTADETVITALDAGLENPLVIAWYSILHRSYDGVSIEDSTAWAILGRDGGSLEEQVYWPAMGADVVNRLRSFQAMLSQPETSNAFFASLPANTQAGALVIHHTAWDWAGAFAAEPCYRAVLGSVALCFDMTGHVVTLPDDSNGGADDAP